jgi:hypothetical protein
VNNYEYDSAKVKVIYHLTYTDMYRSKTFLALWNEMMIMILMIIIIIFTLTFSEFILKYYFRVKMYVQ